jgi:hypothetical protein
MRRVAVIAAVLAAIVLPGCTAAQVKTWFWVNRHQRITTTQAANIARLINEHAAPPTTAPSATCHPSYSPCLPVENDMNCPEIGHKVRIVVAGVDPYNLDADGDGIGCQSYPDPPGW